VKDVCLLRGERERERRAINAHSSSIIGFLLIVGLFKATVGQMDERKGKIAVAVTK
jgi:hypothetical protein